MSNILECRSLTKIYNNYPALNQIDLQIPRGGIVGLLGPNGSGKTTLIKLIAGLLTPTSGEILVDGKHPGVDSKKIVSYLPDHTFMSEWMTVAQSINYHGDFFEDFRRDRAERMIAELGINPVQKIKTLSKGNKEKVALILTMSRDAQLYVLDEPIAGVDPATRDYILHTIITNYMEDSTILMSTHLISDIEQVLSDVIFINCGRIALQSTVDDIREKEGKSVDALFREVFKW